MINTRLGLWFLVAFSAIAAGSSAAQAQVGWGLGCGGGGYWWGGPPYNFSQREYIPYYALHPPVYYSLPVPRTYGYSPFAYPPGVMTPEIVMQDKSLEIRNPYVPEQPKPRPTAVRTASISKVVANPFVDQDDDARIGLADRQ
jgi:hypothetical protein